MAGRHPVAAGGGRGPGVCDEMLTLGSWLDGPTSTNAARFLKLTLATSTSLMIRRPLLSTSAAALLPLLPAAHAQFTSGPSTAPVAPLPASPPSAAPSATPLPAGAIAKIGNVTFMVDEFRPYLAKLNAEQRTALATDPKKLDQFVRAFLAQRLLVQEALAKGWDRQPEAEIQLRRLRENAVADGYLESITAPPKSFPSEEQIKQAYEANQKSFQVPRQLKLSQIFIACPENASPEEVKKTKERIDMLAKYLTDPKADFTQVAKTKSEDAETATRGGEIGWVTEAQIHASIRPTAVALKKGETSAPFRISIGWLILRATDEREARTLSLEEVRPMIVARLREARQRQESAAYMRALVKDQPVTIEGPVIEDLLKNTF